MPASVHADPLTRKPGDRPVGRIAAFAAIEYSIAAGDERTCIRASAPTLRMLFDNTTAMRACMGSFAMNRNSIPGGAGCSLPPFNLRRESLRCRHEHARTSRAKSSSPPPAIRCRATKCCRPLSSSNATSWNAASRRTSPTCCASAPASRSAATADPARTTSLFMRGTDSNHTLVLVDGVRINPGTVGGAAVQNIAPELVDRIEVVKGPRSTLYGTDAIGGVVQIFTRAQQRQGMSAEGGYGADSTIAGNTTAGWQGERAHVGFGMNYLETDGFPPRELDDARRRVRQPELQSRRLDRTGRRHARRDISGGRRRGRLHRLLVAHVRQRTRHPGLRERCRLRSDYAWTLRRLGVEGRSRAHDRRAGPGHASRTILARSSPTTTRRTRRNSIAWQNDFELSECESLQRGRVVLRRDRTHAAVRRNRDRQSPTSTCRIASSSGGTTLVLAVGYVDHETFGGHTTWNVEYGVDVGAATRLVASAGTAFRAPDATDRFGFAGNPMLEPEESRNYELGLR